MKYDVTFIVPTIGRDTLERSLKSLIRQTDPFWNAIVIGDGIGRFYIPFLDNRILTLSLDRKHGTVRGSGFVRNHGIEHACGDWIGLLDDDDVLDEHYVQWLKEEKEGQDVVVFKMKWSDTVVPQDKTITFGKVGISFAFSKEFALKNNLWFETGDAEDYIFLNQCEQLHARIQYSKHIAYYVRP